MYFIYKITNSVNGKIYIGQTSRSIEIRFAEHVKSSISASTYLASAIKKHGASVFTIELLETVSNKIEANMAEIKYIASNNSANNIIGYNLTFGGDGGDTFSLLSLDRQNEIRLENSIRMSEVRPVDFKWSNLEQRISHSVIMKAKHQDPDVSAKYAKAIDAMHSDTANKKRTASMTSLWQSTAYKDKMSKIQKIAQNKPELREKRSLAAKQRTKVTTVKGITFPSRIAAAKHFGVSASTILKWQKIE